MLKEHQVRAYDPTLEKFIQNFLSEKNIAIHLMEDVELYLEGKHIFEILDKTEIHKFAKKMAMQMLVFQDRLIN